MHESKKNRRSRFRNEIKSDFESSANAWTTGSEDQGLAKLVRDVPMKMTWETVAEFSDDVVQRCRAEIQGLVDIDDDGDTKAFATFVERLKFFAQHKPKHFKADNYIHGIFPFPDKSPHLACLYWNNVDQQIHELRIQLLSLFCNQVRRLLSSLDDRIEMASASRLLIELGLRSISTIVFLRIAYNSIHLTLQNDSFPTHHKELSEFLTSSLYPTPVEHNLILKAMDEETLVGFAWLNNPYEPTTVQQFDIAKFYAEKLSLSGGDTGLLSETERLRSFYPLLCKLVHPSPLMFREQHRMYELDDAKIDQAVRRVSIRVATLTASMIHRLTSNFWGELRFLDVCKSRLAIGGTVAVPISVPILRDMLEKYKELKIRTSEGEEVIHQMDKVGKVARKVALDFQGLSDASQQRVMKLIADEQQESRQT